MMRQTSSSDEESSNSLCNRYFSAAMILPTLRGSLQAVIGVAGWKLLAGGWKVVAAGREEGVAGWRVAAAGWKEAAAAWVVAALTGTGLRVRHSDMFLVTKKNKKSQKKLMWVSNLIF